MSESEQIKESVEKLLADNHFEMSAEFVPWSKSKRAGEAARSLNWRVSIKRPPFKSMVFDYSAGIGHCPSYLHRLTVDGDEAVKWECESGRKCLNSSGLMVLGGKSIKVDLIDALFCVVRDSEAINHGDFEEWCRETGFDPDSIKDLKTYQECLSYGLKLRQMFGDEILKELRTLFEQY